jgi:hypothetical protein
VGFFNQWGKLALLQRILSIKISATAWPGFFDTPARVVKSSFRNATAKPLQEH